MISENKVKLQITITKELDELLNQIIKGAKKVNQPLTKSQLAEVALRAFINQSLQDKKEKQ